MPVVTAQEIRDDYLEGYCLDQSIVSDQFIEKRRDNYVIPVIINRRLGISLDTATTKNVYLNGTGKDILFLPDKNVIELISVQYVNTQSVYTPSLANFILIAEEGLLKARYNFNESYIDPVFPKGTRNILLTYRVGYDSVDIPGDINELIAYLTLIEVFSWIESRSGGGNVSSEGFTRQYGDLGKYGNIRKQLMKKCNTIIRNYRSFVI